jgi:uncharacterized OsmC-like protein
MTHTPTGIVKQRQDPLRARYRTVAGDARITDSARTAADGAGDPFHGTVVPGDGHGAHWRVGIHRAVGGYHDLPNPGDMLCAALASCLDTTLRMVADRLEIHLKSLEVTVDAEVDVRGTLVVDRGVPVGFQRMQCRVHLQPSDDADLAKVQMLLAAAEHSCVVLQTLRNGVLVDARIGRPLNHAAA